MLIKLFVENFKSFDSRTEFNMLKSSKIRNKNSHVMHIKKLKLLKHAVIYGATCLLPRFTIADRFPVRRSAMFLYKVCPVGRVQSVGFSFDVCLQGDVL